LIFVLRAVMVSLAFFALLYSFLSVLLAVFWRAVLSRSDNKIHANTLFAMRVMPFAISAFISLFLTLPSFLLFEQHSLDEDLGTFALGACALLIVCTGMYRVWLAEQRTRRVVTASMRGGVDLERDVSAPAITLTRNTTPLMLVGIRVPRILISASARGLLSDGELGAAVRHETAHFRSRDNLKKAILNCLVFPGMTSLERAWQEASELAADDRAVSSRDEALDLAAALIKLARHFPGQTIPELGTGLVSSVDSVTNRVERLVAWSRCSAPRRRGWGYVMAGVLLGLAGLTAKLVPALVLVHSLTERLVP